MKTSGNVHGKTIIDSPATYAITIHERYDVCSLPVIVKFVPNENIIPIKISENNTNEIITIDFFASTVDDTHSIIWLDI